MGNWSEQRDAWLIKHGCKDSPANKLLGHYVRNAQVGNASPEAGRNSGGQIGFMFGWQVNPLVIGKTMEQTAQIIDVANASARESKKILEQLKDDVASLADVIQPQMTAHVEKLRTHRMAVVSELSLSLGAMREVRKFFLESDYATEIDRLERFVSVCRELQALKETGVLDAVADIAIRLAIQEKSS